MICMVHSQKYVCSPLYSELLELIDIGSEEMNDLKQQMQLTSVEALKFKFILRSIPPQINRLNVVILPEGIWIQSYSITSLLIRINLFVQRNKVFYLSKGN